MEKISLIWNTWNKSIISVYAFCFLITTGCTSDKKVDSAAVHREIESREIIKITEAELLSKALETGDEIAAAAKLELGKNLKGALQKGGVQHAVSFCNMKAMPIMDSLSAKYGAKIRRASLKPRNLKDNPGELERELLEAYEYQQQNSLPMESNVQTIDKKSFLFTKPILIDNGLCLTCHGTPENGLSMENKAFIQTKYPNDKATDYQLGDFRGIWSITLDRKKLVLDMTVQ
jgi:hypothetical protein